MSFSFNTKSILDENYCIALPQNSSTVFVFWKFSDYKISQFEKGYYFSNIILRVIDENKNNIVDLPCSWNKAKLYISLPRVINSVSVELYAENEKGKEKISVSNEVKLSYEKETKKDYSKI